MSRENNFSLIGQVTFVPDIKEARNGDHFGNMGLKTTRLRKAQDGGSKKFSSYFTVRLWRDLVDKAHDLERDMWVHITGRIETYKSQQSGQYVVSLVGETLNLVDTDTYHESDDAIPSATPSGENYGVNRAVVDDREAVSFTDDYTDEDLPF